MVLPWKRCRAWSDEIDDSFSWDEASRDCAESSNNAFFTDSGKAINALTRKNQNRKFSQNESMP